MGISYMGFQAYWTNQFTSPSHTWIIAVAECYTKWDDAGALKRASESAVTNFIRDNFICRFSIPESVLSDNGTPFVYSYVPQLCVEYSIDHINKSSPYYPQGNGQGEATYKTLI